jgi:hypothetical protein
LNFPEKLSFEIGVNEKAHKRSPQSSGKLTQNTEQQRGHFKDLRNTMNGARQKFKIMSEMNNSRK